MKAFNEYCVLWLQYHLLSPYVFYTRTCRLTVSSSSTGNRFELEQGILTWTSSQVSLKIAGYGTGRLPLWRRSVCQRSKWKQTVLPNVSLTHEGLVNIWSQYVCSQSNIPTLCPKKDKTFLVNKYWTEQSQTINIMHYVPMSTNAQKMVKWKARARVITGSSVVEIQQIH